MRKHLSCFLVVAAALVASACSDNSVMPVTPVPEAGQVYASGDGINRPSDCAMLTDSGMVWVPCNIR